MESLVWEIFLLKVDLNEFYSFFRLRSPGMPEGKLKRLVEVYFKGREVFTMRSYESSFRKLGGLCRECDLSIFRLDEGARCGGKRQ